MGGDTVGPIPPRCCTDAVPRCRVRRTTGDPMRRFIAPSAASGRWRRRRSARIALAGALVVVAPFVGGPGGGTDKFTGDGTGDGLASGEHSGHPGPSGGSGTLAGFTPGHSPGFPTPAPREQVTRFAWFPSHSRIRRWRTFSSPATALTWSPSRPRGSSPPTPGPPTPTQPTPAPPTTHRDLTPAGPHRFS